MINLPYLGIIYLSNMCILQTLGSAPYKIIDKNWNSVGFIPMGIPQITNRTKNLLEDFTSVIFNPQYQVILTSLKAEGNQYIFLDNTTNFTLHFYTQNHPIGPNYKIHMKKLVVETCQNEGQCKELPSCEKAQLVLSGKANLDVNAVFVSWKFIEGTKIMVQYRNYFVKCYDFNSNFTIRKLVLAGSQKQKVETCSGIFQRTNQKLITQTEKFYLEKDKIVFLQIYQCIYCTADFFLECDSFNDTRRILSSNNYKVLYSDGVQDNFWQNVLFSPSKYNTNCSLRINTDTSKSELGIISPLWVVTSVLLITSPEGQYFRKDEVSDYYKDCNCNCTQKSNAKMSSLSLPITIMVFYVNIKTLFLFEKAA